MLLRKVCNVNTLATRHQACKMEAVCTILGSNLSEAFNCIYLQNTNVVFLTMVEFLLQHITITLNS